MNAARVAEILAGTRFFARDEPEMRRLVADALRAAGVESVPERPLGGDRVDLYLPDGRIALEVKHRPAAVTGTIRQLQRYAASDDVDEVLLVCSRARDAASMPPTLHGKPVVAVAVSSPF